MKTAIALVNQHPELAELLDKTNAQIVRFGERHAFIQNQLKTLNGEVDATRDGFQLMLEALCRSRGLLPVDFDKNKHHFHVDGGAVVVCDETEGGMRQFILQFPQS